jgi:hypothetical protein
MDENSYAHGLLLKPTQHSISRIMDECARKACIYPSNSPVVQVSIAQAAIK